MSNVKGLMSNVALLPTNRGMFKNSKPIAHCLRLFQLEHSNTRTLEHIFKHMKLKYIPLFLIIFTTIFSLVQARAEEQEGILYVIEDTYARGGSYDDDNYGEELEMEIKVGSSTNFLRTGYLLFDVSAYASISSARLQVYGSAQQSLQLSAYETTTTNWTENTLTWTNKPTQGDFITSAAITSTPAWIELDLTTYAQRTLNDEKQQLSIALGEQAASSKTIFIKTKEYESGAYKAKLIVEGTLKTVTPNTIDVYLVIGQSNTAGRATIEAQDQAALENVFLLNQTNKWEQAENPLNAYSTIRKDLDEQGLGYAYTFAQEVQERTGNQLGLVVNARGGSSIFSWRKGDEDGYFEAAYDRLQAALSLPNTTFKGILWHQGEANRNYQYYLSTLSSFINDWRDTLNMPNMPFIAGQLSQLRTDNETFNQNILTLPTLVTNTAVASSKDLNAPDLTHFDSEAQRALGRRYANKALELVYDITDIYEGKYYIDNINGDDGNSGYTPETAWKTLSNINTTTFVAGDKLLFKAGGIWTGALKPKGSGTADSPIYIGRYGEGEKPTINGAGKESCSINPSQTTYCTIHLANQQYWEIHDLNITNYDPDEEEGVSIDGWETKNKTDYAELTLPAQYAGTNSDKCAILIEGNDAGELNHLHFEQLEIHGVNGNIHDKNNGGIFIEVHNLGGDIPTYFNDLLIDECHIHDVDRTGISNVSAYDTRLLTENTDWTPSTGMVVSNTTFERTGANALIIRVAEAPLVTHCLFDHCCIKESGNAAFFFNVDNGIMEYNEFAYTKANIGDNDAGGPDIDFRTKTCTLQYNYLHDNDYGLLVTGGSDPSSGRFNDLGVVRYNIIERDGKFPHPSDGKFILKTSGNATRTVFHNNTIFIDDTQSDTKIAWNKKWGGASSDQAAYHNNIIYNLGTNSFHDYGSSTQNTMSHNLYFGNEVADALNETEKTIGNPFFLSVGNGPSGYQIQNESKAKAIGLVLATRPSKDYYSNEIDPLCGTVDMGVHQYEPCSDIFTSSHTILSPENDTIFKVYPNPIISSDILNITSTHAGEIQIEIQDASNKTIKKVDVKEGTLDVSTLPSGIYYLKIRQKDLSSCRKLLVK